MSKREPQVIIFEDPSEKYKKKQQKMREALLEKKKAEKLEKLKNKKDDGFKTRDHYKEIEELAKSELEQKDYNKYQLEKIGVTLNKKQKIPFKIVVGLREKQRKVERRKKRRDKMEGVVRAKKHVIRREKTSTGDPLRFQPGTFQDGVLHLSKEAFSKKRR